MKKIQEDIMNKAKSLYEVDQDNPPIYTLPLIGEQAPSFELETTKGRIKFPDDYRGKWVYFFSYPGDFCATCTTELIQMMQEKELYDEIGVELLGLSIDSVFSHVGWLESISRLDYPGVKDINVDFPIISDTNREVVKKYGLIRRGELEADAARGAFIIDPLGNVRAIQVLPREVGRSGEEIRRMLKAVKKTDDENVFTPANWQPGDDVLVPKPRSLDEALDALEKSSLEDGFYCPDWYLCYKKDPLPQSSSIKKVNYRLNRSLPTKVRPKLN